MSEVRHPHRTAAAHNDRRPNGSNAREADAVRRERNGGGAMAACRAWNPEPRRAPSPGVRAGEGFLKAPRSPHGVAPLGVDRKLLKY
jgi:hypothetical protein